MWWIGCGTEQGTHDFIEKKSSYWQVQFFNNYLEDNELYGFV